MIMYLGKKKMAGTYRGVWMFMAHGNVLLVRGRLVPADCGGSHRTDSGSGKLAGLGCFSSLLVGFSVSR